MTWLPQSSFEFWLLVGVVAFAVAVWSVLMFLAFRPPNEGEVYTANRVLREENARLQKENERLQHENAALKAESRSRR